MNTWGLKEVNPTTEDAMKRLKAAQDQIAQGIIAAFDPWRELDRVGDLQKFLNNAVDPATGWALDEIEGKDPSLKEQVLPQSLNAKLMEMARAELEKAWERYRAEMNKLTSEELDRMGI